MQALSRKSQPQKLVWSGRKEIIGALISPIRGRTRWQSRRCGASRFWCIKSERSLPRISSPSEPRTPKLSAFLSLRSLSLSFLQPLVLAASPFCRRWWKTEKLTLILIHLKPQNVSWFGLSRRITANYSDWWSRVLLQQKHHETIRIEIGVLRLYL